MRCLTRCVCRCVCRMSYHRYPIQVGLLSLTPECRVTHPSSNIRAFPVGGTVIFEDLNVLANPGTNCSISAFASPTLGALPAPVTFYVSVGTCPVGYEVLGEPNGFGVLCHECSQGLYNINGDGFCRPCPSFGAWCAGGDEVLVAENLWAQPSPDGNLTIERCPPLFCCTPGADEVGLQPATPTHDPTCTFLTDCDFAAVCADVLPLLRVMWGRALRVQMWHVCRRLHGRGGSVHPV